MKARHCRPQQSLQLLHLAASEPVTEHNGPSISLCHGRRSLIAAFVIVVALIPSQLLADVYTFSTIPADGNITGAPGATIGWGYSITNDSKSDWLLATNLDAGSFAFGTPKLLFDFPEVAPGTTVTEAFDPIGLMGLYEDTLNSSAPVGSADSGDFVLSAQWYDGDPFDGGTFIADAVDISQPYTATVAGRSIVPEPSQFFVLGFATAILWIIASRKARRSHAVSEAKKL